MSKHEQVENKNARQHNRHITFGYTKDDSGDPKLEAQALPQKMHELDDEILNNTTSNKNVISLTTISS